MHDGMASGSGRELQRLAETVQVLGLLDLDATRQKPDCVGSRVGRAW